MMACPAQLVTHWIGRVWLDSTCVGNYFRAAAVFLAAIQNYDSQNFIHVLGNDTVVTSWLGSVCGGLALGWERQPLVPWNRWLF